MYKNVMQKAGFFRLPQCDIIYEILSKGGQNGVFGHYTQNISV